VLAVRNTRRVPHLSGGSHTLEQSAPWPQVLRDDFGCSGANCQLYLTGHSRGAPLAAIAAAYLQPGLAALAGLHTFGGCRPGGKDFQVRAGWGGGGGAAWQEGA
jgi:hypothetical protein